MALWAKGSRNNTLSYIVGKAETLPYIQSCNALLDCHRHFATWLQNGHGVKIQQISTLISNITRQSFPQG